MDWANWSTARKILLPASLLLLIDSFLDWQQVDLGVATPGQSMWHGLGFLVGVLLLVLILWELVDTFAPDTLRGMSLPGGLITLALAAAILLFTLIRVFTLDFRHWPAWVGLILAAVIAYGGWLRFQESGDAMPSRSTMSSGGGSSGTTSGGDDMPPPPPPPAAPPAAPGGTTGSSGTGSSGMGGGSSDREGTPPA